jgi:predicted RNA binding protein YcfA (HicA-like mRNA interferase family)
MSRAEKLLEKAQRNPDGISFDDFCTLIEHYGFRFRRKAGSHAIYSNSAGIILNIQPRRDGKAKGYQVRQFLTAIGQRD